MSGAGRSSLANADGLARLGLQAEACSAAWAEQVP